MARSINKAIIVGNLTRDPEMRYTPNGQAVTSFGVATNRRWTTSEGEQREETEFHNVVAWAKLAEICSQLLKKGRKVYIEGRLQTRSWEGKDGVTRRRTEIVARDMVVLDRRPTEAAAEAGEEYVVPEKTPVEPSIEAPPKEELADKPAKKSKGEKPGKKEKKLSPAKGGTKSAPARPAGGSGGKTEDVNPDEIPF